MLKTILLGLIISISSFGFSQNQSSASHFAVFIVKGQATVNELRNIDQHMRGMPDIIMSRMDIPTRRYYVVFNENPQYSEAWFTSKFEQLGDFSIHCYSGGIHGVDSFEPITMDSCDELN